MNQSRSYSKLFIIFRLFVFVAMVFSQLGLGVTRASAVGTVVSICSDTLTVSNNSNSDPGSLRQAIADVCPGGTITFDGDYTITLTSTTLTIDKGMTIDGAGHSVTISGNDAVTVFTVNTGITFNLQNLNVTKGKNAGEGHLGGGIYSQGTLNVTNVTISSSMAYDGGAIANDGGTLTVTNSTLSGNSATVAGGAIDNENGTLNVTGSTLQDNSISVFGGGAISNFGGTVNVMNSLLKGNHANPGNGDGWGGGIYNEVSSTLTVTDSTFENNSAAIAGGGIYNHGNVTVTGSTFKGNTENASYGGGGGIFSDGTLTLTNSTVAGNSAQGEGGGIVNNGTLTLTNSTVAGNSALWRSGIDNNGVDGVMDYANTIIANNTGGDCFIGATATIGTNTHNLVQDGTCLAGLSGDPKLTALADNGGPTWTMALLPGSPAIDAGDAATCPAKDQRGVARSDGHCDIGAFESQGFTLTKTGGDDQSTLINTAFTNPLDLTVTANDSNVPVTGLIVTFTAPSSGASATFTSSPVTVGADGKASVTATANGTAGGYNVIASATGAAGVDFSLTNTTSGPTAPTATTNAASSISSSGATLNGTVNANNDSSTVTFDYGLTTGYGTTVTADQSPVSGTSDTSVSKTITGLTPNMTYHFRVTAINGSGTTNGDDASFSTVCLPNVTVTSTNDSGAGSLRQAIVDVCAGGTINFDNNYTIILTTSTLTIDKDLTIDGAGHSVTISGDKDGSGGANWGDLSVFIVNSGVTANLNALTITKGYAIDSGAGINNQGTLNVTNSTISNNTLAHDASGGAGISNSGTLTVTNSTFAGNNAESADGGAIFGDGALTVTNSTFSGNSANITGGIFSDATTLKNVILANNTGGNCHSGDTLTDGGGNLSDDSTCGFSAATSQSSTNPLLGALGNYGGNTQTFPLLPGSPAIDAGVSATCAAAVGSPDYGAGGKDQRGVTRPSACDIGAFESQGFTFGNLTGTPQSADVSTAFATPLGLTVTSTFSEPVDGGVVTFTAPASGAGTNPAINNATIASGAVSQSVTANSTVGGPYNVTASANGAASRDFSLTNNSILDTTAPVVTAFTATDPSNSFNIPITAFTASDAVGVTGYLITKSSTAPAAGDSGWAGTAPTTYTVLSDGTYTLHPWAKDAADNVSAVFATPATVVVDTTAPTVVLSDNHPDNLVRDADTVTITATFSDVNAIDETTPPTISIHSPVPVLVNNVPMTRSSNLVWTYQWDVPAGNDGTHTVSISAHDIAGNPNSAATGKTSYVIDNTAPTITITNPDTSPALSKTITASPSDGTLTMSNTTVSICDGTLSFIAYASQTFTSESDNGTKVCYKAVDTVGNTAYNMSSAIAGIDTTAPTVVLSDDHTDNIVRDADMVTITATFTEGNAIDEVTPPTISIHSIGLVNNAPMTRVSNLVWTYQWDVPSGNDGTHTVSINAHDTAGNANSAATGKTSYVIDNTAPIITINNPSTAPAQSKTLTASTSDGTLTMSNTTVSICDGTLSFIAYASQTFTSESDNGTKVCYKAVDALGNTGYSLSNAIAGIDTTTPTVTVNQASGQADPTSTSPINFTATFSQSINLATFTAADVTLGGTASGTLTAVISEIAPNNGTTFNIAVSGMSGSGTVTASLGVGVVADLAGNPNTASTSSDNSVTFSIPTAFNKTAPANGATNQPANPVLSWGSGSGASAYWVCYDITNDNACSNWVNNGTATSLALNGLAPNTNYYWQVKAVNASGTIYSNGSSTAFWSFKTAAYPSAFTKFTPFNGSTNQLANPILSWTASVGASAYWYCYDTTNDNACSNWLNNGTARSVTLSGLTPNTIYYWHIRAVNSSGTTYSNGSTTAFWSFITRSLPAAFGKTAPVNGASGQPANPTLSWGSSAGATQYWVCYDTTNDNACSNWVYNGIATSKVLSGLAPSATYYWHVKAINTIGTTYSNGSGTAFWSFTTGSLPAAFNKIAPINGATGQPYSLSLSWGASTGATRYEVCYSRTYSCFNWVSVGTATSKALSGLYGKTTYYWQVRAVNANGITYANATTTDWWFKTK